MTELNNWLTKLANQLSDVETEQLFDWRVDILNTIADTSDDVEAAAICWKIQESRASVLLAETNLRQAENMLKAYVKNGANRLRINAMIADCESQEEE
jgi:hypothetical protein